MRPNYFFREPVFPQMKQYTFLSSDATKASWSIFTVVDVPHFGMAEKINY